MATMGPQLLAEQQNGWGVPPLKRCSLCPFTGSFSSTSLGSERAGEGQVCHHVDGPSFVCQFTPVLPW